MTNSTDIMDYFTLICKPEQSGKTFIMIHEIIQNFQNLSKGERIINIILCDNSLLLNKQTKERLDKDLDTIIYKDKKYIELSSGKNADCNKIDEVFTKIIHDEIDNVIMCTNNKRLIDIIKIINMITKIKDKHTDNFTFKIWLDEADKYTNYLDNTFIPLAKEFNKENKFIQVFGITATPGKLFLKYNKIQVYPIPDTTASNYHGWEDNNILLFKKSQLFIQQILRNNKHLIKPGSKWFIPGKSKKKSHKKICKTCLEYNMAVIIVNGDGIQLHKPDNSIRVYSKDEDFNKKIIDIYNENNLENYPLVITGYVCISRGISIMSNEFIFDYGILANYTSKYEASQLAGRIKGNIKHLPNYKIPTIFTTLKFDKVAKEMETKSRELAKIAAKKEETEGFTPYISKDEYNNIDNVKTVPILIENISKQVYEELTMKKGRNHDKDDIKKFIESKLGKNIFHGYQHDQISEPRAKISYEKNIVELTKASIENRNYSIATKSSNKRKNVYQIWFDYKNHNIIISLYNGANNSIRDVNSFCSINL